MAEPVQQRKMGGGAVVLLLIAVPLWLEFREPGQIVWNIILATLLIAIGIAAILLQRFLMANIGEVGEARFDTRNPDQREP